MGTPREYGFNDISKENILKADPLSFFCLRSSSFRVTPFSRQVVLCGREGGPQHTSLKPSLVREADPATLAYSCASLCQDSWVMSGWRVVDAIHSPGVHRYCRWCWDACARSPVSVSLHSSRAPLPFPIPDKGQARFTFKQIQILRLL